MHTGKISVVMPIYYPDKVHFKQSIESLLDQTYKEFEIIIISDGHDEDIQSIIRTHNLQLIKNSERLGFQKSLNLGIRVARYDFIARQDSDDYSDPTRFERQITEFDKNSNLTIVGTNTQIIDEDGNVIGTRTYPQKYSDIQKVMPYYCPFAHSSIMVKKDVLIKLGGYSELLTECEDYNLWLKMIPKFEAMNISDPLVCVRNRSNSIRSSNYKKTVSTGIRIRLNNVKDRGILFGIHILLSGGILLVPNFLINKLFNYLIKIGYFKSNFRIY